MEDDDKVEIKWLLESPSITRSSAVEEMMKETVIPKRDYTGTKVHTAVMDEMSSTIEKNMNELLSDHVIETRAISASKIHSGDFVSSSGFRLDSIPAYIPNPETSVELKTGENVKIVGDDKVDTLLKVAENSRMSFKQLSLVVEKLTRSLDDMAEQMKHLPRGEEPEDYGTW